MWAGVEKMLRIRRGKDDGSSNEVIRQDGGKRIKTRHFHDNDRVRISDNRIEYSSLPSLVVKGDGRSVQSLILQYRRVEYEVAFDQPRLDLAGLPPLSPFRSQPFGSFYSKSSLLSLIMAYKNCLCCLKWSPKVVP